LPAMDVTNVATGKKQVLFQNLQTVSISNQDLTSCIDKYILFTYSQT
jgi:hypothetical protein